MAQHPHSLESSRSATAVSIGGGDQTLSIPSRAIFVGGAGNLVCRLAGDNDDTTFTGLTAGSVYPLQVTIIRQTGTTATNMVALH